MYRIPAAVNSAMLWFQSLGPGRLDFISVNQIVARRAAVDFCDSVAKWVVDVLARTLRLPLCPASGFSALHWYWVEPSAC